MKSPIPIENIYYLFCYAWDRFPEGKSIEVGQTESPEIWDLFASVIVRGVRRIVRRGLDRAYIEIEQEIPGLRGRIVLAETLRKDLIKLGRTSCRFDELRHDSIHNQIIKATARSLADSDELDAQLRQELRGIVRLLDGIADIPLSKSLFRRVQLSRNNGHYDLLLKICELVHSSLLPEQDGTGGRFAALLQDEARMSSVFEAFVRNFFKAEQSEYAVRSEYIKWDAQAEDAVQMRFLPGMLTDITLRSSRRNIIIDAKYYADTLVRYHGQDKVRSAHLYQLFSYLKNFRSESGSGEPPEGILLYPTTTKSVDLAYKIGGHRIRIRTISLAERWQDIHSKMCALLNEGQ